MEEILRLENIKKSYGSVIALDGVSISAGKGEFVSFLGPSGCGKTTMLRIIAGLSRADEGHVILEGRDITKLPPEKRAVNTVFQNYALFPHMTVEANIGYGLRVSGVKKAEIKEKTARMLELVRLDGVERKYPSQLSGGQKQRVAIARGLINSPKILLLDEPMGALDLQLRRHLGEEIKRIQKESGTTFIYITHDRDEAMNMSDKMVVMKDGRFVQEGTPQSIYDSPANVFVAGFIGLSNILHGSGLSGNRISISGRTINVGFETSENESIDICVRSEHVLVASAETEGGFPAVLRSKSYSGGFLRLSCVLENGEEITGVREDKCFDISPGERVFVHISGAHCTRLGGQAV